MKIRYILPENPESTPSISSALKADASEDGINQDCWDDESEPKISNRKQYLLVKLVKNFQFLKFLRQDIWCQR